MHPNGRDEDGLRCAIKKQRNREHWCLLTDAQAMIIDGWNVPAAIPYISKPDQTAYTTAPLRNLWNQFASSAEGAALKGFSPHDLRATKVCDERISGKTHQQIAAMLGMTISTVMHYSRKIDQRQAARGRLWAQQSAPNSAGPLGKIYDLDEAAAYLRVEPESLASMAKAIGIGATFSGSLRFHETDIRALWEHAKSQSDEASSEVKERTNWKPGWRKRRRDWCG